MDKKIRCVDKALFTDRYGVSTTVFFQEDQVPWLNGKPPKFIAYDCKLWQYKGMGVKAYFYREVESFVHLKLKPKKC
jgi:hypothetical protein